MLGYRQVIFRCNPLSSKSRLFPKKIDSYHMCCPPVDFFVGCFVIFVLPEYSSFFVLILVVAVRGERREKRLGFEKLAITFELVMLENIEILDVVS